jgi:hypothetical protein
MLKTLLVMCFVLVAAFAVAATSTGNTQPANSTTAIRTYLLPDLSLKSFLSLELLAQSPGVPTPPRKRGTCHCSCGFPCATDRDCGGTTCDQFISCCDKNSEHRSWFNQSYSQSSRQTPLPDVLLTANCNK